MNAIGRIAPALLAALVLASAPGASHAQAYPARPVTIIVPYSPGGTTDIVARLVAQHLTGVYGVAFNVDNRPGASGTVAMGMVAKAPPDGYTLYANDIAQTVASGLFSKLPFDPIRDLEPVILVAETPVVMGVTSKLPVKTMQELIAYGQAHPGALNFGSGGVGSGPHIGGEFFKQVTGLDIVHVPYKGSGPALNDLIGGQIQLLPSAAPTIAPHVVDGRIRALAVAGPRRIPALPDVPTAAEAGIPAWQFSIWFGIAAPRGTPPEIVGKLNAELTRMLQKPEIRDRLIAVGADPVGLGPVPFAARIQSESKRWAELLGKAGIKPE